MTILKPYQYRNPYLIDFDNPFNADNPWSIPAPVAWWQAIPTKMGGTVFHDLMGNHHGTLTNMDPATDWINDTHPGNWGAVEFDSSEPNRINAATTFGTWSSYSFAVAVRADAFPFAPGIFAAGTWLKFYVNSEFVVKYHNGAGTQRYLNSGSMSTGWHFVTASFEAGVQKMFVDGVLVDTAADTTVRSHSPGSINFGTGGGYNDFDGAISSAAFFADALTDTQHLALYEESLNYYPNLLNRKKIFPIGGETFHWVPSITGNHTDVVGSNNGTPSGGVSIVRDREKGGVQAAEFDGTGTGLVDHGSIGSVFEGGSTISMWIKHDGNPASQEDVLALENVNDTFNHMTWSINTNGTLYVWYSENTPSMVMFSRTTSQSICDGEWHSISVVLDIAGNDMTIYVDGEISADASDTTMGTASGASDPISLSIGSFSHAGCCATLDDHRVFQRLLAPAEIKELYKRGYQRRYAETHLRPVLAIHPSEDKFGATDGSTVALDLSGGGNNGTITGATYVNDSEKGGRKALSFDGVNDYVDVSDNNFPSGADSRTITFWFNANAFPADTSSVILSYANGSNAGEDFNIQAEDNAISVGTGGHRVITPKSALAAGTWYHVAVVVPGGASATADIDVYIDGVLQPLTNESGSSKALNSVVSNIRIGSDLAGTALFDGLIDAVQVFDYPLNESEIRLLAGSRTAKYIEPEDGLIAWYCPSQDPGSVANGTGPLDLTLGGNNGSFGAGAAYNTADTEKSGTAAFDNSSGSSYSITVPHDDSLNFGTGDFTISYWFQRNTSGGTYLSKGGFVSGGMPGYWFASIGGSNQIGFAWSGGSNSLNASTKIYNGDTNWYHLALVRKDSVLQWYVNGVADGGTAVVTEDLSNSEPLTFLSNAASNLIDNIKIYNRALFPREIEKQYQMERPGVSVSYNRLFGDGVNNKNLGLVTHVTGQGPVGSTVKNSSGFGDDLAITGAITTGTGPTDALTQSLSFASTSDYLSASLPYEVDGRSNKSFGFWAKIRSNQRFKIRLSTSNSLTFTGIEQDASLARATIKSVLSEQYVANTSAMEDLIEWSEGDGYDDWFLLIGRIKEDRIYLHLWNLNDQYHEEYATLGSQQLHPTSVRIGEGDGEFAEAFFFDEDFQFVHLNAIKSGPAPIFTGASKPSFASAPPEEDSAPSVTLATFDLDPRWGAGTNGLEDHYLYWYLADDEYGTNEQLVAVTQYPVTYTPEVGEAGKYLRFAQETENNGGYDPYELWFSDYSLVQVAASSSISLAVDSCQSIMQCEQPTLAASQLLVVDSVQSISKNQQVAIGSSFLLEAGSAELISQCQPVDVASETSFGVDNVEAVFQLQQLDLSVSFDVTVSGSQSHSQIQPSDVIKAAGLEVDDIQSSANVNELGVAVGYNLTTNSAQSVSQNQSVDVISGAGIGLPGVEARPEAARVDVQVSFAATVDSSETRSEVQSPDVLRCLAIQVSSLQVSANVSEPDAAISFGLVADSVQSPSQVQVTDVIGGAGLGVRNVQANAQAEPLTVLCGLSLEIDSANANSESQEVLLSKGLAIDSQDAESLSQASSFGLTGKYTLAINNAEAPSEASNASVSSGNALGVDNVQLPTQCSELFNTISASLPVAGSQAGAECSDVNLGVSFDLTADSNQLPSETEQATVGVGHAAAANGAQSASNVSEPDILVNALPLHISNAQSAAQSQSAGVTVTKEIRARSLKGSWENQTFFVPVHFDTQVDNAQAQSECQSSDAFSISLVFVDSVESSTAVSQAYINPPDIIAEPVELTSQASTPDIDHIIGLLIDNLECQSLAQNSVHRAQDIQAEAENEQFNVGENRRLVKNMLKRGAKFIQNKMESVASELVEYERPGLGKITVLAIIGETDYTQNDEVGMSLRVIRSDYIINQSRMVINGERIVPRRNDIIRQTLDNGDVYVGRVLGEGNVPHYEEADGYGVAWRIHTKRDDYHPEGRPNSKFTG